ncbi:oligopeptidase A [Musca vetustissima]|uniref:oligopeptidase A n=1 Tax=Musca vetustissima TaxID=27455 RepID=UPI002AB7A7DE|nr:oligopeptidase A [Musca vetustissima]
MLTAVRQLAKNPAALRYLHTTKPKNGYIVLVPEIGEEGQAGDVIVKPDGLPAFNDITIENCLGAIGSQAGAVEKLVKRVESEIQELPENEKIDVGRVFKEFDEVTGPLDTTWGIAKALYLGNSTLIPTKSYMNIHERARNARASRFCNKTLFEALQEQESEDLQNPQEKRLLQKYLLEGKLNGLNLNNDSRNGLKEILMRLGKERATFKNKVNVSVHSFAHVVNDYQLVRDFPSTLLEATAIDPNAPITQGPWKFTLQPQIVEGFLKYCPDRMQRWNIWQANTRKASNYIEQSLENSTHLEKIRALRRRQAKALGYPNFATMSMQTKMVKEIPELKQVFSKLLQFAGPAQSVEIENLQQFASKSGFEHKLELCDITYWQRKYLLSEHKLDEEALRVYFPLPRVFSGLFALSEKLFNIKIVERKDAQVWQPAVKYFDVFDCDAANSNHPIGGFYVDCYSKENKFGKNNGWMVSVRNRNDAARLSPLCALIFNFNAPVDDKPYLLNIDDLKMVFKTFGSAMQHLLTRASFTDLAGLSGVEWDASQVASHVMCNFLDNPTILKTVSGHIETDEALPDDLAKNVRLLKTHLAGYNLCQELYLSDLDIELHQSEQFWAEIVRKLWPVYRCLPLDKKDSHPCSWTEIFSGDWGAAYFSHLYSKMIAADISDAFLENSTDISAVGKRFKDTFLASGSTMPTAEVFRHFRGRDPSVEALLKSLDISTVSQTSGDL